MIVEGGAVASVRSGLIQSGKRLSGACIGTSRFVSGMLLPALSLVEEKRRSRAVRARVLVLLLVGDRNEWRLAVSATAVPERERDAVAANKRSVVIIRKQPL